YSATRFVFQRRGRWTALARSGRKNVQHRKSGQQRWHFPPSTAVHWGPITISVVPANVAGFQQLRHGCQEYYHLPAYTLRRGPQLALTQGYFEQALIPALNRLGMSPVGTFRLDIGPETPTYYVLIPSTSVGLAETGRSEAGKAHLPAAYLREPEPGGAYAQD